MIKRIIIITLLVVLFLFLLIIGGSYALLGTDSGFRWTTAKLQNAIPGLELSPTSGNLETGIQTDSIHWKNDTIDVQASGLESQWDSGCLLQSRYCLKRLKLAEVKLIHRSDASTKQSSGEPIVLPEIKLPIDVEADEIIIDQLVLDISPEAEPLVLNDIKLSAGTRGSALLVENFTVRYKNFSLQLAGDFLLEGDYKLKTKVTLVAKDVIDNKDVHVDLGISNSLRKLDMTGTVSGAVDLKLRGLAEPLEPGVPLNLNVYWDELGWPLDSRDTINTQDGLLYLDGTLDDYEMAYRSKISGEQVPESSIELKGQINPSRALLHTVNLFTLDGFFTGSAAATWTDNITWLAELIAKDINPGKQWDDMDGQLNGLFKANGFVADGKWTLDLHTANVDGMLRRFPLSLKSRISKSSDDIWTIKNLVLDNGPNQLSLAGTVSDSVDISTTINFPAVHYLLPDFAGNLDAKAHISGNLTQPDVTLDAKSNVLKTPGALFRNLAITADVKEAMDAASSVKLDVGILNAGGQTFRRLAATLNGSRTDHSLVAAVSGPENTRVQLRAKGSLSSELDWNGQLQSKKITLPGQLWELAKPVDLSWNHADKTFNIAAHCWTLQGAELCVKNDIVAAATGSAVVSLENFQLNTLNNQLPSTARLGGRLSATSQLSWGKSNKAFVADLQASIDQGTLSVMDEAKTRHRFLYERLTLNAKADPETVDANVTVDSTALGKGNVSLRMSPEGVQKNITGDVRLSGFNLKFLEAFLPDIDEVDGNISVAGKLSGTLSDPSFNGDITLVNPLFRSSQLPLAVEEGQLVVQVNGKSATLDGTLETLKDANSDTGQVTIGGDVSWARSEIDADVDISGQSLSIVQNPITSSSVNPNLRIRYSDEGLNITGRVDVPSAQIDIKELPEGTTSLSDDVIIIEDEIEQEQEQQQADSLPLSLKVNVGLGDNVNLSGYGLKAQLSGDFAVSKNGEDPPQLLGEMRVVEGIYKSYGQDLKINDGQILFVGPVDQTTLDIDAVREIDNEDRVAGLRLDGPIRDPSVTLFTEPADKSQESILSYIVLGRDLGTDNTASEQNLLATAALALTIRQGKGFATGFAESLGISDFTLEADGSGDETQVVVSGRLSNKLLLRYGRSVFVPQDTLFLRYDISKRLYLEAAQGLERAVDVFYSFSF